MSVDGQVVALPHTRLRVELTGSAPVEEDGRLIVRHPDGRLDRTTVFGTRTDSGMQFVFEVGTVLGAHGGTYELLFATSTREDALFEPQIDSPGVGWVRLPVRYALTPAGLTP